MRKLTLALAAIVVATPLAAPAQTLFHYTRPPWVRCPANDPTVYVTSGNVFHFPSTGDGYMGHYACRSDAEKAGAKPGKDIIAHDRKAAAAAAASASPAASAAPSPNASAPASPAP